ncbi:uncharacterized protein BJ171DRAFT_629745 [Polychytrium aggregatum]|uniref:uncharacterized protein n=1 Tax=Polychytrium aggregatum TaxID=110093 RepID=UPI0022FEFF62|nr:uncharacterized protein BJ171DRAFT_629745 [Polychytrium aggregatum]KAI9201901.1 hypothetical protein BJ171DRAFT_629745 [Polychytrium aggregatum]
MHWTTLATLPLILAPLAAAQAPCYVRPEWRELTPAQQTTYFNAVNALKSRPMLGTKLNWLDPGTLSYDDFVWIHFSTVTMNAHSHPSFLPWHRLFTLLYEKALQSTNPNGGIVLPYWDWTIDSQAPEQSSVFAQFGGNGVAPNYCVTNGAFAGWQTNPSGNWAVAKTSIRGSAAITPVDCLSRNFLSGATLYSVETTAQIINGGANATDFYGFASPLEMGPHASVHNFVGGQLGDMTQFYSTNDPLFFMLHGMVDKVFSMWQDVCPSLRRNLYNGITSAGVAVSPNDLLDVYGIAVHLALDPTNILGACYSYSKSMADSNLIQMLPTSVCPGGPASSVTQTSPAPSPTAVASPLPGSDSWMQSAILQLINVPPGSHFVFPIANDTSSSSKVVKRDGAADESKIQKHDKSPTATKKICEAPLPTYSPMPNITVMAPPAHDRTDMVHIRHPLSLSDDYIKTMGMNPHKVRAHEIKMKHVVDYYNNIKNYLSPSALIHKKNHTKSTSDSHASS